jgi:multisubunit Na+/H+ antiporter MnhG subunit
VQLALIAAFSLLVNPTAIHALARSASRGNVPLDNGDDESGDVDDLETPR